MAGKAPHPLLLLACLAATALAAPPAGYPVVEFPAGKFLRELPNNNVLQPATLRRTATITLTPATIQ